MHRKCVLTPRRTCPDAIATAWRPRHRIAAGNAPRKPWPDYPTRPAPAVNAPRLARIEVTVPRIPSPFARGLLGHNPPFMTKPLRLSPYLLLTLANLFWAGNWIVSRAFREELPPAGPVLLALGGGPAVPAAAGAAPCAARLATTGCRLTPAAAVRRAGHRRLQHAGLWRIATHHRDQRHAAELLRAGHDRADCLAGDRAERLHLREASGILVSLPRGAVPSSCMASRNAFAI
jgi:hypothetical protein